MAHEEERLAPIHVAEFPVKRRAGGGGDHEGGDDPGEMREAAEIADDARERRADNILVERSERHGEHQPGKDGDEFAPGDRGVGRKRHARRFNLARRAGGGEARGVAGCEIWAMVSTL